ncbi:MAG: vWA domain-containing protein [Alphaproteobacteria bacterium]|nr:vWA domain-containing protein [Alphaproteobacteria bacterium]
MTTNPQPKNAAGDVLRLRDEFMLRARQQQLRAYELENQARQAQLHAKELMRSSEVLNEAYVLLNSAAANDAVTMKLEDLSKKDAAKIAKARFVFLVDGSGSMSGRFIDATIDGLTQIANTLGAQGAKLETVLFGDNQPVALDLKDPAACAHAKRGLNCGTDMFFTVEALAASLKKNQLTHVIVVSDGDLFDGGKVTPVLESMLRDFPQTTLDVVQLSNRPGRTAASFATKDFARATGLVEHQSMMQRMIEGLEVTGPRIRPQMSYATPETAADAITDLLAKRLSEIVPAVKKAPALKRPASGK